MKDVVVQGVIGECFRLWENGVCSSVFVMKKKQGLFIRIIRPNAMTTRRHLTSREREHMSTLNLPSNPEIQKEVRSARIIPLPKRT